MGQSKNERMLELVELLNKAPDLIIRMRRRS